MSSRETAHYPVFDGFESADQVEHALVLNIVRQEVMEQSEQEADIIDLGTLSGGESQHLWKGGISRQQRIDTGEITEAEVEDRLSTINSYFVPVGIGAPKRCVDGSSIVGYDDSDPTWYARALGPQVQGGSADEAFAKRLVSGIAPGEQPTLLTDIKTNVVETRSRFAPGDHTDDRATDENCGCGAIVGMPRKLAFFNDIEATSYSHQKTNGLLDRLGIQAPAEVFERMVQTAQELNNQQGYLPAKSSEVLDLLASLNPRAIETLKRPHAEVSVTINLVPDTTFHRDHYNAQTADKIQNFNLDAWVILEEYGEEGYAVLVDAVQTLMDLTDGSLRLLVRVPSQNSEEQTAELAAA